MYVTCVHNESPVFRQLPKYGDFKTIIRIEFPKNRLEITLRFGKVDVIIGQK